MYFIVVDIESGFDVVEDDVIYYYQEQNIQVGVGVVVDYDMVYVGDLLCGQFVVGGNFFFILLSYKEEVFYLWVVVEQFQVQCSGGVQQQLCCWDNGDLDIFGVLYFDQYYGVKYQCYGGQYLVRDFEQWLQVFYVVQWVDYVLIQQVVLQFDVVGGIDNFGDQ